MHFVLELIIFLLFNRLEGNLWKLGNSYKRLSFEKYIYFDIHGNNYYKY